MLKRRGGLGRGLAGLITDGNQFGDRLARALALGGRGAGGLQRMGRNDAAEGLAGDTRGHNRLLPWPRATVRRTCGSCTHIFRSV